MKRDRGERNTNIRHVIRRTVFVTVSTAALAASAVKFPTLVLVYVIIGSLLFFSRYLDDDTDARSLDKRDSGTGKDRTDRTTTFVAVRENLRRQSGAHISSVSICDGESPRPDSYRHDPMCQRTECGGLDAGDDNAYRRDSDHHKPETREHPPPTAPVWRCRASQSSVGRGNCEAQDRENGEDHMYPDHGHENSSPPRDIDGVVMLS